MKVKIYFIIYFALFFIGCKAKESPSNEVLNLENLIKSEGNKVLNIQLTNLLSTIISDSIKSISENNEFIYELYIDKRAKSDYLLAFMQCPRNFIPDYLEKRQPLSYTLIGNDTVYIYTGIEHFLRLPGDTTSYFYKKIFTRSPGYSWTFFIEKDQIFIVNDYYLVFSGMYADSEDLKPFQKQNVEKIEPLEIKSTDRFTLSSNLTAVINEFINKNLRGKDRNNIYLILSVDKKDINNYEINIGYQEKNIPIKNNYANIIYIEGIPLYIYNGLEDFMSNKQDNIDPDFTYRCVNIAQPIVSWTMILSKDNHYILRKKSISWNSKSELSRDTIYIDPRLYAPDFITGLEEYE